MESVTPRASPCDPMTTAPFASLPPPPLSFVAHRVGTEMTFHYGHNTAQAVERFYKKAL